MYKIVTSIRVFLTFAILLGLGYPLLMVGLCKVVFPYQANGSLLKHNGKIVGSTLIAQEFTSDKYFHSRFSAVNYDARQSGANNFAPSDEMLYEEAEKNIKLVRAKNDITSSTKLPADMVLSSASGLDPHISLENALLQLPRVVNNRSLQKEVVEHVLYDNIDSDFIGIWGESGVNVLRLNLALDKLEESEH